MDQQSISKQTERCVEALMRAVSRLCLGKRATEAFGLSLGGLSFRLLRFPAFTLTFGAAILLLQPVMEATIGVKQALHSFVHHFVERRLLAGHFLHIGHVL